MDRNYLPSNNNVFITWEVFDSAILTFNDCHKETMNATLHD